MCGTAVEPRVSFMALGPGCWSLKVPPSVLGHPAPLESISELRHCVSDFIKNVTKTHALRYATSVLSGAFLRDGSIL